MEQATHNGENFSVTLERSDDVITITAFRFLGFDMPIDIIPDNVYDALIKYADEVDEWE